MFIAVYYFLYYMLPLVFISRSRLFEKWKYKIILSIDNKYSVEKKEEEEEKNTKRKQKMPIANAQVKSELNGV